MRTTIFRNNRGSVMMQVLAATAVMSISFYFLTNYVIGQKKQVTKTVNAVNLRFALNSTMDYVIFGVRQKWCFTDGTLVNDSTCNLASPFSVERVIMSNDQENAIRTLVAAGANVGSVDLNNVALKSFKVTLNPGLLSSVHPLFPVMQKLKTVKDEATGKIVEVAGVTVELTKDTSAYLPRAGRESYLTVKIALIDSSKNVISMNNVDLSLRSSLAIYPREVGSFALLAPKDLHMDNTYDATYDLGDIGFHQFTNRKDLGKGPGLVFLSPVFVNNNIYLPQLSKDESATPENSKYSAVTFADRVYIGNGWVKSLHSGGEDDLYVPRSAGGLSDRYWADSPSFGGFLKGIENDGGEDAGLKYFAKINTGDVPDTKLLAMCATLSKNQASVETASKTKLGASKITSSNSGNTSKVSYKLFFDTGSSFEEQGNYIPAAAITSSNWSGVAKYSGDNEDAVINLTFLFDGKTATHAMPLNSQMIFQPVVGSASALASLNKSLNTARDSLKTANTGMDDLNAQLSTAKSSLSVAQASLDAELAKPVKPTQTADNREPAAEASPTPTPSPSPTETPVAEASPSPSPSATPVDDSKYQNPDTIASLNAQISNLKTTISDLSANKIPNQDKAISDANAAINTAQNALNNYNDAVQNPPQVTVDVKGLIKKINNWTGRVTYYGDKLELDVTTVNANHFINSKGELTSTGPSIGVLGYDSTYYNSKLIPGLSIGENTALQGYLNFGIGGAYLTNPTNVAATSNSPAEDIEGLGMSLDDLNAQCEDARSKLSSQSFGGADWNVSFASTTRHSWNFAGIDGSADPANDPVYNKDLVFGATPVWKVASIVGNCIIPSNANLVTGFYACDSLTINARTNPLRIIGTFIVGKLKIDPSAYVAGIQWSSIYLPQATKELRKAGILKPTSNPAASCDSVMKSPIWHPIPSVQEVSDVRSCNAISLRAQANPFQWTAVDPDCGMVAGATQSTTTCKKRLVRFYVVEQSRESGI
ncbi:hypothetical protein [Bdellovibrio sp. NC01]|uniref:hypothetical protein n=1 Tax=Bdellovibrio sp. NC01 TaxID=2220073 RepID=UPI001158D646|nr:hypothetical protein [Bdellovibrio sp. NC01]QDK38088.1 hypothetical protein DOE51_11065 [Bdellovibrio sp. NC01]